MRSILIVITRFYYLLFIIVPLFFSRGECTNSNVCYADVPMRNSFSSYDHSSLSLSQLQSSAIVEKNDDIEYIKDSVFYSGDIGVFPSRDFNSYIQKIAQINNWAIFIEDFNKKNSCFCHAISNPFRTSEFSIMRNEPYFAITYIFPNMYTISTYSGFVLKKQSAPLIIINEYSIALQRKQDMFANSYSSTQDAIIISSLLNNGILFKIKNIDENGNVVLDYYSLKGFVEALNYMKKYCSNIMK